MGCGSPTISLVIPTYNRGHRIAEIFSSALAQDPPFFEIIVIDDGPINNTKRFWAPMQVGPAPRWSERWAAAQAVTALPLLSPKPFMQAWKSRLDVFNGPFARWVRHANADAGLAVPSTKRQKIPASGPDSARAAAAAPPICGA